MWGGRVEEVKRIISLKEALHAFVYDVKESLRGENDDFEWMIEKKIDFFLLCRSFSLSLIFSFAFFLIFLH